MRVSIYGYGVVRKFRYTSNQSLAFLESYLKDIFLND